MLGAACSLLPQERERPRAEQMERAVLPMARAALDAGQVETARRLYRRVLQVDSDSVDARMGLGDAAVATRDSAAAARWYLAALANAKRSEERHAALLAHGRAALSAGQLEAARKSFARLTEPDEGAPQSVAAWGFNGLGLTLLLAGDPHGGAAAMEQAVLRAPDDARFQGNLTRALAMLTEFDDPSTDASATDALARAREPMLPAEALPTYVEPAPAPLGRPRSPSPDAPVLAEPASTEAGPSSTRDRAAPPPREPPTPIPGAGEPEAPAAAVLPAAEPGPQTLPEPPPSPSPAPERVAETDDLPEPERPPAAADASTAASPPDPAENEAAASVSLPAADPDVVGATEGHPVVLQEDAWTVVQPAAYASRTQAERLSERLRELTDHPVWVSEGRTPAGEPLSRVRIGPVPSRDALVALGAALEAEGFGPLSLPPPEREMRRPTGAPPLLVTAEGERYVQAGAYAVKAAAEELAARLAQLTRHATRISEAVLPGGQRVYRVRIGPVESGQALDDLAAALEEHGYGRVEAPSEPPAQPRTSVPEDPPPIVVREAGRRFVQTGAYASAETAAEAADRVTAIVDQPVRLDEARPGGDRVIYRVRIGPVPSYEDLVTVADALEVAGYGVMTVPPPDGADAVARPARAADTGLRPPPSTASPFPRPPPLVLREGGERFLQAGAYAARATAEALATQLRDRVPPPVRVTETVHADGRALYRVRVGPIGPEMPIASLVEAIEAARRSGD